jgi:hypothetical protein
MFISKVDRTVSDNPTNKIIPEFMYVETRINNRKEREREKQAAYI